MDIYKLSDEVPGEASRRGKCRSRDVGSEGLDVAVPRNGMGDDSGVRVRVNDGAGAYEITDMKQGVKNENRVNIFVNGKYSFSLDIAQVVEFGLKIGRTITEEELTEYKKASEFGKLYQRALEKALTRPHSKKEISDYLYKKIYEKKLDKNYINDIIEKLESKRYIDDKKFAEYYVENRFVKKGVSQKRLKMELMKKGVSKDIIEEALAGSERNDEEEILKIIAKKRSRYSDEKLIMYLARQGFSFELARSLVQNYEKD